MSARFDRNKVPHEIYDMREPTPLAASEAALDAAIRAGCDADGSASRCDWPHCQGGDFPCNVVPVAVPAAIRAFLDAVENSQQPISHDAMQTLRAHLGEQARDGG